MNRTLRNLLALTRRELAALFLRPSMHVVTAFFVLLYGLYFSFYREQSVSFESLALIICFLSIFLTPLITMRSFAEELESGTMELLMTAPVTPGEVVASKFLGCYLFYLTTLLPCIVYIILLAHCGKAETWLGGLDVGEIVCGLLALGLVGALFIAAGLLLSSLTSSQIVAAASSCVLILILLMLSNLTQHASPLAAAAGYLSFVPHFKRFLPGVIDTRDLVYFLSLVIGLLLLTRLLLSARGTLTRPRGVTHRGWELAGGVMLAVSACSLLTGVARLHISGIGWNDLGGFLAGGHALTAAGHALPFCLGAAGTVLALLCMHRAQPTRATGLLASLRHGRGSPVLLQALGIMLIVANLNLLVAASWRGAGTMPLLQHLVFLRHRSWDLSPAGSNTLALDTRMTLDELTRPLDIYVFYSADVDYQGVNLLRETRKLLTRYADYSSNVRVIYADPLRQPARANQLCRRFRLDPALLSRAAIVACAGRRLLVPAAMALKPPSWKEQLAGIKTPKFNGELVFTLAIKRLLDPRVTRVYFSTGHRELAIASQRNTPGFAGKFAQRLRQDGIAVRRIVLDGRPLPYDCDVLVMLGPHIPLAPAAAKSLAEYLGRGGRLLLSLPSVMSIISSNSIPDADDPALLRIMGTWGCRPQRNIIIDQQHNHAGMPALVQARAERGHPVANSGRVVVCALPYARSLRINPDTARKNGWLVQRLLTSYDTARAQVRVKDRETGKERLRTLPGPFDLALAASAPGERQRPESRVIVVGNTEFVSNLSLSKADNRSFAVSCVHWLAGRDYRIRIEPRAYVDRSLKLNGEQQRLLQWVSLVGLPMVWLLLGALVWWARKQ